MPPSKRSATPRKKRIFLCFSLLLTPASAFLTYQAMLMNGRRRARERSHSMALASSQTQDLQENMLESILDQSVQLYSSLQLWGGLSDATVEQDIREFRQREIVALVEDTGKALDEQRCNEMIFSDIQEVSVKFDEVVMNALESNDFDNEEIANLALEHYRLQLKHPLNNVDRVTELQTRLEQLRVLIAPTSYTVKPQGKEQIEKKAPNQTKEPEVMKQSEAPYFAVAADAVTIKGESNGVLESMPMLESHDSAESFVAVEVDVGNEVSKSEPKAEVKSSLDNSEKLDAVSAVIAMGAVAAALVTKVPVFAAGAALGPVMSSTVSAVQHMKHPFARARPHEVNGTSANDV